MSGIYNILSLVCGFVAIVLPVISILKKKINNTFSFLSLTLCIISIYSQICKYNYSVFAQDWSSLLDTSAFLQKILFFLLIIVILLNIISNKVNKKQK